MVQTETGTEEVSIYAEADATLGSTGCVLLHSPYGRRVHEPWAMAVQDRVERTLGFDPQAMAADDGILLRVPMTETRLPGAELFAFDPDDDPFLLNRGARQLLALASIVVLAPPVVVLDEPTTGLDYRECVKVMDIIRRIHERGTTVVMVCHDMEVVADYAARCIVMSGGEVVDDAPTFDVLRNRETLERASLVPPQIVDLSLELGRAIPRLADAPVGSANTVDEMLAAVVEEARGAQDEERSVSA